MTSLTCIGIGNMGSALASTLSKSGARITIWNRTADRPLVTAALEAGCILARDLAAAITANDILLVCVLDYVTLHKIMDPVAGRLAGKTLINLTNGTPREAEQTAVWAAQHGVDTYVDGAVMVTPQMVGGPHSFIVGSGESEEGFARVRDIMAPLGAIQDLGRDVGAAARFDVAALASMYGMFNGSFLAMALLKKGKPEVKLGSVVAESLVPFLTALVPYLGVIAEAWDAKRWGDSLGNPMGMQVQGLKNIMKAAEDDGIDTRGMRQFVEMMEKVVEVHGADTGLQGLGPLMLNGKE